MSTTTGTDDNPLGSYLKDRRARLDPAALGLPLIRRRTPGLRREEVAQRAFVGVTWHTWLEQGRAARPRPTCWTGAQRLRRSSRRPRSGSRR